jgi:thiamine-phosphate pyrophosphorylase
MIHNKTLKIFHFIDDFNKDHIKSLDKKIGIIYRNYKENYDEEKILKIKKFCKHTGKTFYLANNIFLTIKLRLDGAYIPSFNRKIETYKLKNKKILLLGSAHNLKQVNQKKKQGIDLLFISPVFKVKKQEFFLGISRFNLLANLVNGKSIALGGINKKNINKLNMLNSYGFASISYINQNKTVIK